MSKLLFRTVHTCEGILSHGNYIALTAVVQGQLFTNMPIDTVMIVHESYGSIKSRGPQIAIKKFYLVFLGKHDQECLAALIC